MLPDPTAHRDVKNVSGDRSQLEETATKGTKDPKDPSNLAPDKPIQPKPEDVPGRLTGQESAGKPESPPPNPNPRPGSAPRPGESNPRPPAPARE